MIYLTYNDPPSGVYSSQVSDVCNFLNNRLHGRVRLVAIISLHDFFKSRAKIKKEVPGALVLPALPKARYWQFTSWLFAFICLLTGEKNVIARNVIAANIVLFSKRAGIIKKLVLDGRGAIAAEWNEYQVVPDENMKKAIHQQERKAVTESDYRIAVSSKLVEHWKEVYGYNGQAHVIIPCTLNSDFNLSAPDAGAARKQREVLGYQDDHVVMVYSGSTAGWQSFNVLGDLLGHMLEKDKKYKLLFLANDDENIKKMKSRFPEQVMNQWVKHSEVQLILSACDFGILYRENTVTNQVASPTKFAEYLSAGLPVLISENLGDYTEFVKKHGCGKIIASNEELNLTRPGIEEKRRMVQLAIDHFTKVANQKQYETLMAFINNKS